MSGCCCGGGGSGGSVTSVGGATFGPTSNVSNSNTTNTTLPAPGASVVPGAAPSGALTLEAPEPPAPEIGSKISLNLLFLLLAIAAGIENE